MEPLKENSRRASLAITMIWVVLALDVLSLISSYFQYNLLQSHINGAIISDSEANANDTREQIVGILYMIVFIISAITFIQWFRRAYFNLHQIVPDLKYQEGWAAGAWFVPIINLFRPYQIMKELYEETRELLSARSLIEPEKLSTGALGTWWTMWIISNVIGQIVFRYARNGETVEEFINMTLLSMAGNFVGIPLAINAIKIIKDYSAVEDLLPELEDDFEDDTIAEDLDLLEN